ncbi:hypothetical protein SNL152K_671 [Streptomyces sp. NL15-2K]|nr:hypothetical protein SNL152K_671 [Streptomyces sp. NL15-2K]
MGHGEPLLVVSKKAAPTSHTWEVEAIAAPEVVPMTGSR